MISGRRAAREAALLVLFAADVRGEDDFELALGEFADHLRGDDEVIADLFSQEEDEGPVPPGLMKASRELLRPNSNHWSFVERLVRGVAAHNRSIDELIGRCSLNWKLSRMGRVDRNILRLAAYELAFEPDVPSKATLNEAIEMAKRYGTEDSGKFVNGILDRIAQDLGRV